MAQETSIRAHGLPVNGSDIVRQFIVASFVVSIFCLGYVIRHRIGVTDPYSVSIFWHLLITQDYWGALLVIGLLAVAMLARNAEPVLVVVRALAAHPSTVAVIAFIAFSGGSLLAYHDYALSMDEYSARFQADVFAAGHIVGHFPADLLDWLIPKTFQKSFLVVSPRSGDVVSYFMPGFALLLTPFTFIGIPWACNPAIGALSLLALHRMAREITGSRVAGGWAMLFALASPAFSINAMSYYSMSANLLFSALYSLLLFRPTTSRALLAGLVGGLAVAMHSPPPHLLYAVPWIVWLLVRRDFRCLLALAFGYLPLAAVLGFGWLTLLGELRNAGAIQGAAVGAAKVATGTYAWGWLIAIGKILQVPDSNTLMVRIGGLVKLWVWAVPGLPLLAWFGFASGRSDTRYRLLLASAITTFVGYLLIPYDQGHGWGYRYFHTAWGVLAVLAAAAMAHAEKESPARTRFVALVGVLALGSLLCATALRAVQVHRFVKQHLDQISLADPHTAQVAFVDTGHGYYTIDMVQNRSGPTGKVLIMVSHGPEQNAVMARRLSATARRVSGGEWGELWLLE
jgi:hypothetical protein